MDQTNRDGLLVAAATETVGPTTTQDAEDIHPLLQRHLSTIGIGDVFVNAGGPSTPLGHPYHTGCTNWWLPRSYLGRNFKSDNNTCHTESVSGTTVTVQLWEMVGKLKTIPEDFVVREIFRFEGENNVGELLIADDKIQPKQFFLHELGNQTSNHQHSGANSKADEVDNKYEEMIPSFVGNLDPIQDLSTLLKGHSIAEQTIEAIRQLHQRALAGILDLYASPIVKSSAVEEENCVIFSIVMEKEKKNKEQRKVLGEIPNAIREAFPLLKTESLSSNNDATQWLYTIKVLLDECFYDLIPYLHSPAEDLPPLYEYFKRGYEYAQRQSNTNGNDKRSRKVNGRGEACVLGGPMLRLRPNNTKEERRYIHHSIETKTKGMIGTRTVTDYPLSYKDVQNENGKDETLSAIKISWTKVAQRRMTKKRKRENREVPWHSLCVIRKRLKEHFIMTKILMEGLEIRQCDIGLAGIKDMHAVTYQFATLAHVHPRQIEMTRDFMRDRGLEIQLLCQVSRAIRKGEQTGNRFDIVVRNLRRVQLLLTDGLPREELVPVDATHVKQMVDRLTLGYFVNFYGAQRVGIPGSTVVVGFRSFDIGRALLQQKWWEAINCIISGRRIVNNAVLSENDIDAFRRVWIESKGDIEATTRNLPKDRGSANRERVLLKGLTRYGRDNPLAAFQCLQRNERTLYLNAYQSYIWNKMATERIRLYGIKVVLGDLIKVRESEQILIVDETTLHNANIEDVVLPMPGFDSIYPKNEVLIFFEKIMKEENVSFLKNVPDEAKIKGSYRRLIERADNVSYELTNDDDSVNVKFSFNLPSGTYATMFFRELMLSTVARDL